MECCYNYNSRVYIVLPGIVRTTSWLIPTAVAYPISHYLFIEFMFILLEKRDCVDMASIDCRQVQFQSGVCHIKQLAWSTRFAAHTGTLYRTRLQALFDQIRTLAHVFNCWFIIQKILLARSVFTLNLTNRVYNVCACETLVVEKCWLKYH